MGWFADPIFFGRYPAAMTERIPGMPVFSREEQRALLHSIDFFGNRRRGLRVRVADRCLTNTFFL